MSLSENQTTAKNFKKFFEAILPYLGGNNFDDLTNRPELPEDLSNIIDELPNGATVKSCVPMNNKFNRADIYSTTEKIVGAWTDGKPLYQKTFDIDLSTKAAITTARQWVTLADISGLNPENVTIVDGFIVANNHNAPLEGSNNSGVYWLTTVNLGTDKTLRCLTEGASWYQSAFGATGGRVVITIQYTKTTDTAGSFNPSTETDYSTSETVVGTWIDGKPIYQKTWTNFKFPVVTTDGTNASSRYALEVSIDALISIEGIRSVNGDDFIIDETWNGSNQTIYITRAYVRTNADSTYPNMIELITNRAGIETQPLRITLRYTKTTD